MKTAWKVAAVAPLVLVGVGLLLVATNPPPEVPVISTTEAAGTSKPFVVKAHARWCPVCMTTTGVWEQLQQAYAGRVNLVVLDLTTEATSEAGRAEARRLGLEKFFDDYMYETGTVFVLDGRSKEVKHSIHGSRDFAEYRAAIDEVLRAATP